MKKIILGVKIDDLNMKEGLEVVEGWLSKSGKHYIVTPNPEMLVEAQNNAEFKETLNKADLAIPDGKGLQLAGIKNNVPGVEFMENLVKLASEEGWTVGLLGAGEGVAGETAEILNQRYPNSNIVYAVQGVVIPAKEIVNRLSTTGIQNQDTWIPDQVRDDKNAADLLFVALGHVKQEKWIAENLPKIPVKVAMGVGGSFDYISGKVPRAPKWLRNIGLEWLFRLIIQPWRIKRQLALLKDLYMIVFRR